MKKMEEYVRSIPDFPEKGIIFRDVTSVLQDADGLALAIDSMRKLLEGIDFDVVVGTESRGFIFGVPIAYALHKAFVPVRKKGKLPLDTISKEYDLEYSRKLLLCLCQYFIVISGNENFRGQCGRDFCIWIQYLWTANVYGGIFWNPAISDNRWKRGIFFRRLSGAPNSYQRNGGIDFRSVSDLYGSSRSLFPG